MYVMGNFSVDAYKNAGLSYDQIDFFPFPKITPGVPRAEEAPAVLSLFQLMQKIKEMLKSGWHL